MPVWISIACSLPTAKPLKGLSWLKPGGTSFKYPDGIRAIAAATSVICKLYSMAFQLKHFNIYRWQGRIKQPFLKQLVISILGSPDDPETQGRAASFLAICELPHLVHDTYETLERENVISQLMFTQLRDSFLLLPYFLFISKLEIQSYPPPLCFSPFFFFQIECTLWEDEYC